MEMGTSPPRLDRSPARSTLRAQRVAASYHAVINYQPANRFWAFQGLETALFVVAALALVGLSFWWVRHRIS